ncbi:hypothetical protein DFJ43DRAFT_1094836 [Lentinula guzmanii]|uniref:Uncharacterized protein n=1 Tax=Lentinula guzmanii TaxID=2804957 RepID=A0AA38MWF6_9AGAR|nr:hypothetical protein DFJ43DRAFT_1094836 [Lentinula guzmanii]
MQRSVSPNSVVSEASMYSASSHASYAKRVERRFVQAWKTITGATRKSERTSFIPPGFALVNVTKRRSIMFA